jgi:hypothetical protein
VAVRARAPTRTLTSVLQKLEEIGEARHRAFVDSQVAPRFACQRHNWSPAAPRPMSDNFAAIGSLCPACYGERRKRERDQETPEIRAVEVNPYAGSLYAQRAWEQHREARMAAGRCCRGHRSRRRRSVGSTTPVPTSCTTSRRRHMIVADVTRSIGDAAWMCTSASVTSRIPQGRDGDQAQASTLRAHQAERRAVPERQAREGRPAEYARPQLRPGGQRRAVLQLSRTHTGGAVRDAVTRRLLLAEARGREESREAAGSVGRTRNDAPRVRHRVTTTRQELLTAKLPGTRETDVRRASVGALLASHLYGQPEDRDRLLHNLLPRDVHTRSDLREIAEDELRTYIDELNPADRDQAWELLTTAP